MTPPTPAVTPAATGPGSAIEPSPFEKAFHGPDVRAVAPRSYAELAEIIRDAEARGATIIPAGAGSHAYLGWPPPAGSLAVSLREFDQVLRYEPDDFTVGVQAGALFSDLRALLARNGQEIPVDAPARAGGTVGGMIAVAPPGPRRGRYGPVRSFVIGVHGMRGGGSLYKAGGMVVKNVAGYEVMKFLAGSLGTAGPLLEINFKLRPLPAARAGRIAAYGTADAAWRLARALRARNLEPAALWSLRGAIRHEVPGGDPARGREPPASLDAATVAWVFEGHPRTVDWQMREADQVLAAFPPEDAAALDGAAVPTLIDVLLDASSPGDQPREDLGIVRLAALPSTADRLEAAVAGALAAEPAPAVATDVLAGLVTARWSGPAATLDRPIAALAAAARGAEANGILVYLPPDLRRAHGHFLLAPPNRDLSLRIRRAFDPAGVFFAGRVLGALT
jgi:glycolate oxidase FAD binding subunit